MYAKSGVDISKLIAPAFTGKVQVSKKQFKLKPKQLKKVQNLAKARLDTNVIRLYTVKKKQKVIGHGVLLLQEVHTKKAAVLYVIGMDDKIKSVEIVAFMEPSEYKPNKPWLDTFIGRGKGDYLFAGKGVPITTGATLTARTFADVARLALAIVKMYR